MAAAPLGITSSSLAGKDERQSTKSERWLNPSIFSFPMEIKFISHKINHLKVNSSVAI